MTANLTSNGPIRIGSNRVESLNPLSSASFPFDGDIDEFRIWDIARSTIDIQSNMNIELSGSETGLVSYYNFNHGVDCGNNIGITTLIDSSLTTNDGILYNFGLIDGGVTPCVSNWNGGSAIGTDFRTECDSLVWIDGNTYYTDNNTATFNIVGGAANISDSLVALDLTINSVDTSVNQSNDTLIANEVGATYQWIDCGNGNILLVGDTNQTYIATANGNYAVIITNNGCSDTSSCYTITGVGMIENDFKNNLLLYPNPTDGNFSIDLGQNYQIVTVTITDVMGKIVQANTYNKSQLLNLKLEEPAEIYFLNIQSANNNAVIRLVKE